MTMPRPITTPKPRPAPDPITWIAPEDYFSDHESPVSRIRTAANRRRSWEEPAPVTLAEILASLD